MIFDSRATNHVMKFPRHFCILQAIKNQRLRRPRNEAKSIPCGSCF